MTNRVGRRRALRPFFCFLAHPNGLTKEQAGALFWPDCTPNQLRSRFKNAVYRLRSALSREVILFFDDLYRFDWSVDYDYDAESFGKWLKEAQRTRDASLRRAALQRAVDLYSGPYLADVDALGRAWSASDCAACTEAATELAHLFRAGRTGAGIGLLPGPWPKTLVWRMRTVLLCASTHRRGNWAGVARNTLCARSSSREIAAPPSALTEALCDIDEVGGRGSDATRKSICPQIDGLDSDADR